MKKRIELNDQRQSIVIDYENGVLVFRNFRLERHLPRMTKEFSVSFDEVGRNSVTHHSIVRAPSRNHLTLETTMGRVWIPASFRMSQTAIEVFDALWKENLACRTDEEMEEFRRKLDPTSHVARVAGIVVFLSILAVILYYFLSVLPDL